MSRTVISRSAEETFAWGVALGKRLQPGDFIGLIGGLGSGKTQLVRGVAEGAGVPKEEVSSPTFAIVQPYQGRLLLYHADLYRLANHDELYGTGFFDLLDGNAALLVEWIDRISTAAPKELLTVVLEKSGEEQRALSAEANGTRHQALLEEWLG